MTGDGTVLYDSRVICEYFNSSGRRSFDPETAGGALANFSGRSSGRLGILDAAVLVRYGEDPFARPECLRWQDWIDGRDGQGWHLQSYARDERTARRQTSMGVSISGRPVGCALGCPDLRYASLGWKNSYAKTAAWYGGRAFCRARPRCWQPVLRRAERLLHQGLEASARGRALHNRSNSQRRG